MCMGSLLVIEQGKDGNKKPREEKEKKTDHFDPKYVFFSFNRISVHDLPRSDSYQSD